MYGSELEDDEDEVEEEIRAQQSAKDGESAPAATEETESIPEPATEATPQSTEPKKAVEESHRDSSATTSEAAQKTGDEGEELLPRAVHDATSK
jgi:intermembrane space import and assembly protein 40